MTPAPLLVVDGDSFAHRAFHAMPKTIQRADGGPAGAIVGFTDMLRRLWLSERPRAVFVGWDTLGVPTYRNDALPGYQGGREFDPALVEQLDQLPRLLAVAGVACAKQAGYEADDFLAAAAVAEEAAAGRVLVATSDRDAYQLASEHTTILQPVRGGGPPARIDPEGVVERYGVRPDQVVDFIALRGDPSDRIPGARGVGEKTAAARLATDGSLDAVLEAGRFEAEAEALLLYRRIAALDRSARLPPLPDSDPDWRRLAVHVRDLGLDGLARRLEEVG
jgi:DNA polymerase-1